MKRSADRVKAAEDPSVLYTLAKALMWAWWNGYRPVPGYTVCAREANGDLYLAVQMTKDKT